VPLQGRILSPTGKMLLSQGEMHAADMEIDKSRPRDGPNDGVSDRFAVTDGGKKKKGDSKEDDEDDLGTAGGTEREDLMGRTSVRVDNLDELMAAAEPPNVKKKKEKKKSSD